MTCLRVLDSKNPATPPHDADELPLVREESEAIAAAAVAARAGPPHVRAAAGGRAAALHAARARRAPTRRRRCRTPTWSWTRSRCTWPVRRPCF